MRLPFALSAVVVFMACVPTQEVVNKNNMQEKAIAISENDIVQGVFYPDVSNDSNVKTGKLENGMTYYIMPNQKPEKRAELRLVVKTGSIDEDPNQLGLAHFIEHMAFNGTKNFKKNELVDYLESVGSRFGPDLNAYTSFDETVYMLQVRTDDDAQLQKGLLVLSDWASGLTFDPEEVEKERGVVISEWRSRLSPAQRMQNEYLPVLLKGSRYANRLPIGDPEIIQNADLETIKKFYYNWYRPDLMSVIVVGDVNVNLIEDYVHTYFDGTPKAINPRKKNKYTIPSHDATLIKVCSDKEAPFTQVQVVHKMPEARMKNIGDFIERLKASLATTMLNNRLVELTKKQDAPFLYGFANQGGSIGPIDAFTLFGVTSEGASMQGLEAIMTELKRAELHGFQPGELQRAKDELQSDARVRLNEADKTESSKHAGRLVNNFLSEDPYPSAEDYHWMVNKYVPLIRKEDVSKVLKSWISDSNRVVIVTSPEKEGLKLPNNMEVLAVLDKADASQPEPYVDEVVAGPLAVYKNQAAKVVSKETVEGTDIEKVTLSNGASVLFKTTDFNNDEILFSAKAAGGSSVISDEDYLSVSMSPEIVRQSGLSDFSATDLSKKLSGKKVNLYSYVGDYNHGLRGDCAKDDAKVLGDLLYLHFTDLRQDEEAFNAYISRTVDIYANLDSDPQYYFRNTSRSILYQGHVRRSFPSKEELAEVKLETSLKGYQRLFSNPRAFVFIFVGNLTEEIKQQLLTSIGSIPPSDEVLEKRDIGLQMASDVQKTWKKGEAPKTFVQITYSGDFEKNEENEMALSGFRDLANIKLREALREDKGGVYGVRVSLRTEDFPEDRFTFTVSFNCDPPTKQELVEEVYKVLKATASSSPVDQDMTKVVEQMRQQYVKGFKENRFWLSQIQTMVEKDTPLSKLSMEEKERKMGMITKSSVLKGGTMILSGGKVELIQEPEA